MPRKRTNKSQENNGKPAAVNIRPTTDEATEVLRVVATLKAKYGSGANAIVQLVRSSAEFKRAVQK